MLPPEIATDVVYRLRGHASPDSWGDSGADWSNPNSLPIYGCSVQPVQGDENVLTRDSVTSRWNLFLPMDADVRSSDRIRHRGVVYEVDGSVQVWPDFFGYGHKVALLRLVEG